ncbi:hypothetical protein KO527_17935 [Pseudoalteromonas sp. C2R02]|uniref:hypothetical protein n=1 Tax=Pseudoalteromonas sp. C2R02 TaxID=2841565 RepID=UPI001C087FE9|nr:hypothetical protein [Pseudoalteromonas sp. C2R02]MBU2971227.1 hypothetical protein [Pseudoalteromonas sp. C2R02]
MNKRIMFQVTDEKGSVITKITTEELSLTDLKALKFCYEPIFFLQPITYSFESFERNISDLNEYINLISNPEYKLFDKTLNPTALFTTMSGVQQKCSNILASANAFLLFVEKKLKSKYGKDSEKSVVWNKFRRDLHKENLDYRLMYELRNYSIHYGLPVTSLKYNLDGLASSNPSTKLIVNLSKEKLLNSNFNWKNVRSDIKSLPENNNLISMVFNYSEIVKKIYSHLLLVLKDELKVTEDNFSSFIQYYQIPPNCTPHIISGFNIQGELTNVETEVIPINELNWILRKNVTKKE